jgi:hypothetical protein
MEDMGPPSRAIDSHGRSYSPWLRRAPDEQKGSMGMIQCHREECCAISSAVEIWSNSDYVRSIADSDSCGGDATLQVSRRPVNVDELSSIVDARLCD